MYNPPFSGGKASLPGVQAFPITTEPTVGTGH